MKGAAKPRSRSNEPPLTIRPIIKPENKALHGNTNFHEFEERKMLIYVEKSNLAQFRNKRCMLGGTPPLNFLKGL